MNIIALAQRRRSHVEIAAARRRPLAHLGSEERNPGAPNEAVDPRRAARPRGRGAEHDQRTPGFEDHFGGTIERGMVSDGDFDRMRRHHRNRLGLLACNVLRKFQQHRSRPLLDGDPEGIAHQGRDRCGADDLPRHLGQRLEGGNNVNDLEAGLPAGHDALLPGDHHHRHGAEQRVGRAGSEVERAGPERRDANAGFAGEPAIGRGHERGALLVPGQHQLDRGSAQTLDHVEIFLAGNAEDAVDALVLQRGDNQVRTFGHAFLPIRCQATGVSDR